VGRSGLSIVHFNAARYFSGLRMSGFTTALGILSIVGGLVQLFGAKGVEGAFLLIVLGGCLILK
jgi:hypothetical protein